MATIRIAHLSDIHFGMENAAAVAGAEEWLSLHKPDLSVITGDLTSGGAMTEFVSAAKWVNRLAGPTVVVPGNHDTPYLGLWERLTAPFARYTQSLGRPDDLVWATGGISVAGINTARGMQFRANWSKGAIRGSQYKTALAHLHAREFGGLSVVAIHHPLVDMIGGPMTAKVHGGQAAARAFCGGGVDLILSGHIHVPFATAVSYDDCLTYAVGAGTLSIRERGVPPGFNLIEADDHMINVTALAWVGNRMEPWRNWAFARRRPA